PTNVVSTDATGNVTTTYDIKANGGDVAAWYTPSNLAVTMRQDGSNSYICNKANFVSNGAGNNGYLMLGGQGGVRLAYGTSGSYGTSALDINTSGNIGIGTTSQACKLDVSGLIRATGSTWPTAGAGIEMAYSGSYGYIQGYNRGTSTWIPIKMGGNVYPVNDNQFAFGASSLRWTAIYAVNGTIQTSDKRLKKDIKDMSYGLDEIMKLHPVSFTWKENDNGTHLGLVAQDVLPVIKEVVDIGEDEDETLGINYSELVPVLIKAIQEQQKKIEALETRSVRMDQIEKDNNLLKSEIERIKASLQSSAMK
ncbi:MAG: tail fiber domain-containing protein, partial [Bacteroidetes bacterium]|nr:tail fiber domain-containing protein [Bacteroidota bacterium]